ncbi:copper transporter 5 [Phtheirospermum japonicum]|uniref:Copper transporter 5 n=1 Tax=Phtheirospermum japonicum TaxID=374723 RepID=A0A830BZY4_9LAMI|nr:copper transporter 5 [Phtheirospermum japonicum]
MSRSSSIPGKPIHGLATFSLYSRASSSPPSTSTWRTAASGSSTSPPPRNLSASKNKPEAPPPAAAAPLLFSKVGGSGWAPSRYAGAILSGINSSIGV